MSEDEIVYGVNGKNIEAFNLLYEKSYKKYYLFSNNLIGDPEESKDIVTDAFIKVAKQENYFQNFNHLESYFYSTIKNSCIDYLRRNKKKAAIYKELAKASITTENVIEKKYQEAELITLLYNRVNELPDRMKQVFTLSYLEGFNRTEIADMLDISENTVRNTNAAAMKALKLAFSDCESV